MFKTYRLLLTLRICENQTKNNGNKIFQRTLCSIKYCMKGKDSYSIFDIKSNAVNLYNAVNQGSV